MSTAKSSKTATVIDPASQVGNAIAVQKETIETVVKAGTEAAVKSVDKAVSLSKEQVDAAMRAGAVAVKGVEDLVRFGRDNVDAWVASGSIVARGFQDISKSFVAFAQESFEESVAAGKAIASAKTLKDVFDLSSSLAKTNYDRLVSEGSHFSQVTTKLAQDAFTPLRARVSAAVEQFTKPAA